MPIITLTTDFGATDAYVGMMKGVLLSIAPTATIVDLCHGVPPQDVVAGALILEESARFFETGTIHVAVVDPGVGSARTAIALETNRAYYVGPDNGLFDPVVARDGVRRVIQLDRPHYHLPAVSSTFHGRDVFAPVAAHLAQGADLDEVGSRIDYTPKLTLPSPVRSPDALLIHVLRVDHFGNLITDLTPAVLAAWRAPTALLAFKCPTITFNAIIRATFSDVPEGTPVAYFGSSGRLELAIRNGHAAQRFQLAPGGVIELSNPESL